jgi:hypothetical protein
MNDFEELERTDGRSVMCPRCGRQKVAGNVFIVVRRKQGPGGTNTKQVASTQLSMCEACCVQVFTELQDNLYSVIEHESRAGKKNV